MKGQELKQLSRTVAHALRHEPELYGLKLDDEGWASLDDLIFALRRYPQWSEIREEDVEYMALSSPKQRYQIKGDKIKALYGHSFEVKVVKEEATPPEYLFFGTTEEEARKILHQGLSMPHRQYVHLSANRKGAYMIGKKKSYRPIILTIDAEKAAEEGVRFYKANIDIWLSDSIPPHVIRYDDY